MSVDQKAHHKLLEIHDGIVDFVSKQVAEATLPARSDPSDPLLRQLAEIVESSPKYTIKTNRNTSETSINQNIVERLNAITETSPTNQEPSVKLIKSNEIARIVEDLPRRAEVCARLQSLLE